MHDIRRFLIFVIIAVFGAVSIDAQQPDPSQIDYLYVDSLERITRAGLSKTGLVLRNEDGSISLSFER